MNPDKAEAEMFLHHDIRGLAVTAADAETVALLDRAVESFVSHGRHTAAHLADVLARDPDNVAALALRGLAQLLLCRWETTIAATAECGLAMVALARRGGTPRERGLVEALRTGIAGDLPRAAACVDALAEDAPHDLAAIKLGQALRFLWGDARGMRRAAEAALPHWPAHVPGAGYVLGCLAFAQEETGAFDDALTTGRRAVDLAPRDAWGMHAVAHVHEMRGDVAAGLDWLGRHRPWAEAHCNNFRFHVAWHEALLHLDRGDDARTLDLYDRDVRPLPTDDYRDVANAASLLARLEQHGVAVGARWEELADIAEARIGDVTLTFAALHYLVALLGARRLPAARRLAQRLAESGEGFQAHVAAVVGADLARTLCEISGGRFAESTMAGRRLEQLSLLGGSHSQRDLFIRILMLSAARAGRVRETVEIHASRREMKADDRFVEAMLEQLATAIGHPESAFATV